VKYITLQAGLNGVRNVDVSIDFDISLDGITTKEIANWLKLNPNSGMPRFLEIGDLLYSVIIEERKPDVEYPRHVLKISAYGGWEAKRRSEGLSEQEIEKWKKQRQSEFTGEIKGHPSSWFEWDNERMGLLTILSIGSGCQIVFRVRTCETHLG
jgi:hypothetical protein